VFISVKHFTTDDSDSNKNSDNKGESKKAKDRRPPKDKKENFAKKYLDPASRGELKKHHGTGIPKLAVRKPKGHLVKDDFPGKEMMEHAAGEGGANAGAVTGAGDLDRDPRSGKNEDQQGGKSTQKQKQKNAHRKKYKRPEDLSHLFQGPKPEDLDPLQTPPSQKVTFLGTNDGKGSYPRLLFQQNRNIKGDRGRGKTQYDFFGDEIPEEELNDPWPSSYMAYSYINPHDESKRVAKPTYFPKNRKHPPMEFLETYKAFAYVTDVPHPVFEDELGQYENPMHRHEVNETVANAFGVPVGNVFASTMTSAFVGFEDAKAASDAYGNSSSKRIIEHNVEYCLYSEREGATDTTTSEEEQKFVSSASSPECIIQISNLPGGMKIHHFIYSLQKLIKVSVEDVHFTSPTTLLLKTNQSVKETKDFVEHNTAFENIIKTLSRQILRVQAAKLAVVHDKFVGPAHQFEAKKTTNKLVADGDIPSSNFYLSHGQVLHLSNLHPSITKKEISDIFQPYCILPRDVEGSIEFVKSLDGYPTGRAYIGFDRLSEAEKAWKTIFADGQKVKINEHAPVVRVRPVKERRMLRGKKLGERTERTQEELLYSLQSLWEEHVDPKDIEYLESVGVARSVLEDAFMTTRYNNPTFGVEDLARVGERMHDDKVPGQAFEEFVQLYVETLKDISTTKENPGRMFEGLFFPGEELDLTIFDEEEERLSKIEEERKKVI